MMKPLAEPFDVGPHGISGHFDLMLGSLRKATPRAVFAACAWMWIALTWPPHTAIFRIGPALTLGGIVKLGLTGWTIWAGASFVLAFIHWSRWRALEAGGLRTIMKNDHRLRVLRFDPVSGQSVLETTTQQERIKENRAIEQESRRNFWEAAQKLGKATLITLAVPLAFILIPTVTGRTLWLLTGSPDFHVMAYNALANGNVSFAHWCSRPDVQAVLGQVSVPSIATCAVFFLLFIPKLSTTAWWAYDRAARADGNQYIPGAKVLEPTISETTLDTLRGQQVHGHPRESAVGEAARRLSE